MNAIIRHIEYLLRSYDCVVLPEWGAFLIHETPAHYDAAAGTYLPPRRSVGFNSDVRHNDGLLVGSVARRNRCSIEAAAMQVDECVRSLRAQLDVMGEVRMGSLGSFTLNQETAAPVFMPDDATMPADKYSFLRPVQVAAIDIEAEEETTEEEHATRIVNFPIFLKIAASVMFILVAAGLFYSTSGLVSHRSTTLATLDSGFHAASGELVKEPIAELPVSRDIQLNIARPSEAPTVVDTVSPKPSTGAVSTATRSDDRYLLVVASFPSMDQARRHISGHPDMRIAAMDGKYRVYVAGTKTLSDAYNLSAQTVQKYPSVWICKR